mgnify:CR=1 FL=1
MRYDGSKYRNCIRTCTSKQTFADTAFVSDRDTAPFGWSGLETLGWSPSGYATWMRGQ